jgi:hypothetical protein
VEKAADQAQTGPTPETAALPSSDTVAIESDGEQKGVIRNLLAGHYKGVADVRLRINFFDELAAMDQNAVRDSLSTGAETFSELGEDLRALAGASQSVAPEIQEASLALKGEVEQLVNSEELSRSEASEHLSSLRDALAELSNMLREALDSLAAEQNQPMSQVPEDPEVVESLVNDPAITDPDPAEVPPQTEEPPSEPATVEPQEETLSLQEPATSGEPQTEPVEDPTSEQWDLWASLASSLLEKWDGSLGEALESMDVGLAEGSPLPPVSAPADNKGRAYDKFLAIYTAMSGSSSQDKALDEAPGIDVEA